MLKAPQYMTDFKIQTKTLEEVKPESLYSNK